MDMKKLCARTYMKWFYLQISLELYFKNSDLFYSHMQNLCVVFTSKVVIPSFKFYLVFFFLLIRSFIITYIFGFVEI